LAHESILIFGVYSKGYLIHFYLAKLFELLLLKQLDIHQLQIANFQLAIAMCTDY